MEMLYLSKKSAEEALAIQEKHAVQRSKDLLVEMVKLEDLATSTEKSIAMHQ